MINLKNNWGLKSSEMWLWHQAVQEEFLVDCSSQTLGGILPTAQWNVPQNMNLTPVPLWDPQGSLKWLIVIKSQGKMLNVLAWSSLIYWPVVSNSLQIDRLALSCILSDKQMKSFLSCFMYLLSVLCWINRKYQVNYLINGWGSKRSLPDIFM